MQLISTFLVTQRATGPAGFERMHGHWHSESGLYQFIPEFVPRPVAFGTYASNPDAHFILLEFEDMIDDYIAPPEVYCKAPVALCQRSAGKSPTGQFGFGVNTQFGSLSLQNGWEDSWEVWFTKHITRLLELEEEIRGPFDASDAMLKKLFLSKVLPRYLRPLESDGRSIQPTLCHTDLWPGNVKYREDYENIMIFDANALWAHNESRRAGDLPGGKQANC
jgi:protein-ribulosamine 3-kinase